MNTEGTKSDKDEVYFQRNGSVEMTENNGRVYPRFHFEKYAGILENKSNISYPKRRLSKNDDREIEYPEIDFRGLSNISDTGCLTHRIHNHPAVFIPQIPEYLIRTFTSTETVDGDRPLVLDPFNGSGTVGVESKIKGRDYLGVEINPLSKLVSKVSTTPIPPTLLKHTEERIVEILAETEKKRYPEYDVEFLDRTNKHHWFEQRTIRDLTRIRKAFCDFSETPLPLENLNEPEQRIINDLNLTEADLRGQIKRWLALMIANTVFDVSNADPDVSKAHKSPKMREKIKAGDHPPKQITQLYATHVHESRNKLTKLWDSIYSPNGNEIDGNNRLDICTDLNKNHAHNAKVDIRLGDAREFDYEEYKESVDLAITSPPYINAMNYYRGTKLRLFWIHDLLEEEVCADDLRTSIVGTNSSRPSEADEELPARIRDQWSGDSEKFDRTNLPALDDHIRKIHDGSLSDATARAYTTWRFFAQDMLRALSRVYEHLKSGGLFFLVIGENTVGGRKIESQKFVADIAENLGEFSSEARGGEMSQDGGFRIIGTAWDKISSRALFHTRDHDGGIIEREWVVMMQKP